MTCFIVGLVAVIGAVAITALIVQDQYIAMVEHYMDEVDRLKENRRGE